MLANRGPGSPLGDVSLRGIPSYPALILAILVASSAIDDVQGQAQQCTHYVAPTGSDSKDGRTLNSAFRTIQRASDGVNPGDVVCVRGGAYGPFTVSRSGTPTQPVIFRTYQQEKPIIQAPSGVYNVSGIAVVGSFVMIDGFTVRGGDDGILIYGPAASYNRILNCDVSGGWRRGITIWDRAHHNTVKGCRVYDNARENWPRGIVTLNGVGSWGGGVIASSQSSDNTIEENYIYWNHGEGLTAGSYVKSTVFRRNVIADNWAANIYLVGTTDAVVEDNVVYLSNEAKQWPNCVARCYNNNASGIDISIEYHAGDSPADFRIRNNILVNTVAGIRSFINDASFVADGLTLANNTFVNNESGIFFASPFQNVTARNNIILQDHTGELVYFADPRGTNAFSHNSYHGGKSNPFRWGSESYDFQGWMNIQEPTARGTDPKLADSSIIPARLWNDPSLPEVPDLLPSRLALAAPYRLTPSSPAIDAGTSQDAPSSDIEGNPRPRGAGYDIGAYEFQQGNHTTFVDVPSTHWAYPQIEALFHAAFLGGCSEAPRLFCPQDGLSRAEAAVFVVRGLRGGGFLPPEPESAVFSDVALEAWFAKWADALWLDRFTSGCGTNPLSYCPLQVHTRAEGAVFFVRMLRGADYLPPQPGRLFYSDVALDAWYAKWVATADAEGLTRECEDPSQRTDTNYRPTDGLTRAEAACMLAKAKDW
ncbi:MAG TPA: right-handed parallel beta-helix repeat-containing protein [Anaerolineales bacterium]|nr:right-handed parallel beta-helix repeat-containing protein [Anaerolineales bacterium]